RANYLASPPLVVAYALAGTMNIDLATDPLGRDRDGKPVYLKDIWPSSKEIQSLIHSSISERMFRERYADVFKGDKRWRAIKVTGGLAYDWSDTSTYIRQPPFFEDMPADPPPVEEIESARILGLFLDSMTT